MDLPMKKAAFSAAFHQLRTDNRELVLISRHRLLLADFNLGMIAIGWD